MTRAVTPRAEVRRRTAADSDLDRACVLLAGARRVVVLAHIQPDADALGSALALGLALRRRGVVVQVSFAEPDRVPPALAGLPGAELIVAPTELDRAPDLLVTVDVNTAGRLGTLATLLITADHTLVIDHHASNTGFGTDHLVDPAAESTTVLIAAILDRWGDPLDPGIAANLYAGLATDSVGFRHAGPAAHRLAARLLETGIDPDEVMRPVTDVHPVSWLSLLSTVLGRATLLPTARPGLELAWTWATRADLGDLPFGELDPIIDLVRTTAPVAAVFKELQPDLWQVSLRSLPEVDVAAIAVHLGGGGHRRAAGYLHRGAPANGVETLCGLLS